MEKYFWVYVFRKEKYVSLDKFEIPHMQGIVDEQPFSLFCVFENRLIEEEL